ncbi:unnamed protein product [Arabidopsis lyrata]|uniref:Expressed protein n=1 Tax=Arabidopsis lyrata subsp. lyrata TaxID=81972 RepID=D7LH58_ARALL|nr:uncharacterized protein LOC9315991 [Arabidopsis lyrata subsp. lyrata]EFH58028.1 expressed protein [Arabidopsis lyrata subsp. lyrata]CAH8265550.1 unnamed protein product [Arabidopsis lyrata]|eukprot:XP_002881769.1 uncharacterized protein LOC9315991 [Arabidopsis lyrata subsp. lyrata]
MASDEEILQSRIEKLKEQLHKFGSDYGLEGTVLCQSLNQSATQVAFAFPSIEKKVNYAKIVFSGKETYVYEADKDDENHSKQATDKENVDLVLKQIEEAKWIASGLGFENLIEYERSRIPNMNLAELRGLLSLLSSLIKEATAETKIRTEELKRQTEKLKRQTEPRR